MPEIYQNNIRIINVLNTKASKTEFCSCELLSSQITSKRLLKKEDFISLFFATWIDQVIYWVLVDSGNEFCLNDSELYETFHTKLVFPKFWQHGSRHYARPVIFLIRLYRKDLLSENKLLLLTKLKYWNLGGKKFFLRIGRRDIIKLAEQEFIRDLSLRHRFSEDHERKLKYLWETKLIN